MVLVVVVVVVVVGVLVVVPIVLVVVLVVVMLVLAVLGQGSISSIVVFVCVGIVCLRVYDVVAVVSALVMSL